MAGHWFRVALVSVVVAAAIFLWEHPVIPLPGDRVEYRSHGWFRESIQWDSARHRFLVSLVEGGIGEIQAKQGSTGWEEKVVVTDRDYRGYKTLGLRLDEARRRVLIVVTDLIGQKFSALAAYDSESWERVFLTELAGSETMSLAADVALDLDGNAYVTDAKSNAIWRVSSDGKNATLFSQSFLFGSRTARWPLQLLGLKGIEYHPDGYLLVMHAGSGALFKVPTDGNSSVTVVQMKQALVLGSGMLLLSPQELVVAGVPGAWLLSSSDGWRSATLSGRYVGAFHRIPTSAAMKDGKVYVGHLLGAGIADRTFTIQEAIFDRSPKGFSQLK